MSTEGLLIYSVDELPAFKLDIDLTPQSLLATLAQRKFLSARHGVPPKREAAHAEGVRCRAPHGHPAACAWAAGRVRWTAAINSNLKCGPDEPPG